MINLLLITLRSKLAIMQEKCMFYQLL